MAGATTQKPKQATTQKPKQASVTFMPVLLLKNYQPMGEFNIIGKPAESPYPGVGQEGRLWAGTKVELPVDEARRLIENVATSVETGKDARGEPIKREIKRKVPIAERADDYPA